MAVETSAVQIVINVTDANSGAVVAGVTQNIQKIGAAGAGVQAQITGTAQSFQGFGVSGTIAGRIVKQNLEEVGKEALSTREKTRLLTEEFGIRIPRAMQSLIAQSTMAKAVLQSLTTVMIGLGAIQIGGLVFGALISGAEKAWHFMTGLSKGTQDYLDQVQKTKEEDFGNTRSIEDTDLRIQQATQSVKDFRDQAQAAKEGISDWSDRAARMMPAIGDAYLYFHTKSKSNAAEDKAAKVQAERDKLVRVQQAEQLHQQRVSDIDVSAETRRGQIQKLPESARPKAERDLQVEEATKRAHEEQFYGAEQDKALANPVDPNRGADKEKREITLATLKAENELGRTKQKNGADDKSRVQELARLHEEALESGLRGSALYRAQEAAAIEDLKRRHIATDQAISDVRQKFHNEQMKRLEDENRQVAKMREAAQLSGLTSVARIQQEGRNQINDVYSRKGDTNPGARLAELKTITNQTQQAIAKEQESFADHVNSVVAQSADRAVSGFARIHADAEREIKQLEAEAKQKGGKPEDTQRGVAGYRQTEADQVAELRRKNADETEQLESQARSKLLSAEKNQTAAIEAEYEQRFNKYKEQRDAEIASGKLTKEDLISVEQDYNRRVLAAGQIRDADMVESAQRAREKMAGEFSRFFSNPLSAMKEMGNKAAGEAAAALMQRVQGRVGAGGSTGEHLGMPGSGMMDSLFGRMAGSPKGGANAGFASPKMLSFATAQIQIGTASIAFGGGGIAGGTHSRTPYTSAGATGALAGFSTSGGSTGLLASEGASSAPAGSTAAPMSFGGSTAGSGAAPGGGIGAAIGDVQQGASLFGQVKGLFGSKSAASSSSGGSSSGLASLFGGGGATGAAGGASKAAGVMGMAGGLAGGAMGMYSAVEGNGGVGGALSGAMSGMQLGMILGGPIGAAIGAAGGAIIGAIGFGGKEKARVYDLKTVRPRIAADILGYQQGTMDYTSAYSDMQSLDMEAKKTLKAMGGFGNRYYWDTVIGEIHQAEGKLSAEQRAGRSNYTVSAASYDVGTDSVPRDGLAMIHERERIMPSDQNERITRAIEGGADSTRMAAQPQSGWGGDIHIHAIDAKSSVQWLMANKHNVRSAMNASFAENSGGSDA